MAILRKLPAAVAVAALTATLVGCGSSDVRDERDQALMERDQTQAELDQTQAERDQAQADLEAAQAEAEAAQAELDAAQAEAEAAQAEAERLAMEQAAAEEAAAAAEQARMEAEQARMEEEAARMEAEGERDALQEAADEATSAADIATAKALLASLGDADPDSVALPGRSRYLGHTTGAEAPTLADPNPDTFPVFGGTLYTRNQLVTLDSTSTTSTHMLDTTTSGANKAAGVTASSGGEVEVSVTGYTQTDTVPDMIEGFRGVELTQGSMNARTLWVYTDIEDATAGPAAARLDASYHSTSVPGRKTYSVDPRGATANANAIPWTAVTRIGSAITTVGTGADQVTSFEGSVNGLPGTFSCTGTCTPPSPSTVTGVLADLDNDGFVTSGETAAATGGGTDSVGDWTFVLDPDLAADVMDGDGYLTFGWWLHKRGDDKPIAESMNVATFAQASGLAPRRPEPATATTPTLRAATPQIAGNGAFLTGTATYSGGAAGKYAIAETTTDHAHGGHFTAKATLTADFDADSDGNSATGNDVDGIKLTGMIDNFMTGEMARDWTVSLSYDDNPIPTGVTDIVGPTADESAATNARASTIKTVAVESPTMLGDIMSGGCAAGAVATTGTTCGVATAAWDIGGASMGMGSWSATYYGGSRETDLPTAIVGRFSAALGGLARITGAYGASMDMEEDMTDEEMGN